MTSTLGEQRAARSAARWLPQQRWFAAKGRPVASVAVAAGDRADHRGRSAARPGAAGRRVRRRRAGAALPAAGRPQPRAPARRAGARRRSAASASMVAYDGLWDPEVTGWLLDAIRERPHGRRRPVRARAGRARSPTAAAGRVLGRRSSPTPRCPGASSRILKLFRRVLPGVNPDLELHRALRVGRQRAGRAAAGRDRGRAGRRAGRRSAMLQDFAANSAEGWAMALASVRDLLAEGDLRADEVGGDFAAEASRLGETVAVVHAELRAGARQRASATPASWPRRWHAAARPPRPTAGARRWPATRSAIRARLRRGRRRSAARSRPSACTATCTSGRRCAPPTAGW